MSALKVCLISLGCAKNQVDSEVMLYGLQKNFQVTDQPESADIIVINTCGFIQDAKEESLDCIIEAAQLKQTGSLKKLIVTGCLVQRYKEQLKQELPEVDALVGLADQRELVSIIRQKKDAGKSAINKPLWHQFDHTFPRALLSPQGTAYLRISDGCDNRCSYCSIPGIRGPLRSRSIDSLLIEAQNLANMGIEELIIISQDSGAYGRDLKADVSLTRLLEALIGLDRFRWIRLLYIHPLSFCPDLLDMVAGSASLLPYFDLPLQHISGRILSRMGRRYDRYYIERMLDSIRERIDDAVIRTTFIVGFPGETASEFDELLRFAEKTRFNHLGVFAYSQEEDTEAYNWGDDVPLREKIRRRDEIMSLQAEISHAYNQKMVGKTEVIKVDGYDPHEPFLLTGRVWSQNLDSDGITILSDIQRWADSFVEVKIVGCDEYDLVAEPANRKPDAR